ELQWSIGVEKDVHPSTLFHSSVVRPNHRFAIGSPILKLSGVDDCADTDHAFTSRDVRNVPNITADGFQRVKPSRPLLSDVTAPFGHVASGINKKGIRRFREKAFH